MIIQLVHPIVSFVLKRSSEHNMNIDVNDDKTILSEQDDFKGHYKYRHINYFFMYWRLLFQNLMILE